MLILCRKCKKTFNPQFESAACYPYIGHMPVADCGQRLPASLQEKKEPQHVKEKFQSDFKLIWGELNG